jgi:hypothetical protein
MLRIPPLVARRSSRSMMIRNCKLITHFTYFFEVIVHFQCNLVKFCCNWINLIFSSQKDLNFVLKHRHLNPVSIRFKKVFVWECEIKVGGFTE